MTRAVAMRSGVVALALAVTLTDGAAGARVLDARQPEASRTGRPGVAQNRPAAREPELVGRGTVSTDAPEFASTITPDGRELYFNRASADRAQLMIMIARRGAPGQWSAAVTAPFSGTHRDVDPFVTPDGRQLYFSSDRPRRADAPRVFATWYVERTPSGWSAPVDPGAPLNSEAGDVFVSAARDGTVVFTSSRLGTPRLFTSREVAGRWQDPVPLTLGARNDAGNAALAPSGRFMVVSITSAVGGGGGGAGAVAAPDLFMSCRVGASWSEPRLLTGVNSPWADFAPFVDAQEAFLYFTSERPGVVPARPAGERPPGDIYRIALADAGIACP